MSEQKLFPFLDLYALPDIDIGNVMRKFLFAFLIISNTCSVPAPMQTTVRIVFTFEKLVGSSKSSSLHLLIDKRNLSYLIRLSNPSPAQHERNTRDVLPLIVYGLGFSLFLVSEWLERLLSDHKTHVRISPWSLCQKGDFLMYRGLEEAIPAYGIFEKCLKTCELN